VYFLAVQNCLHARAPYQLAEAEFWGRQPNSEVHSRVDAPLRCNRKSFRFHSSANRPAKDPLDSRQAGQPVEALHTQKNQNKQAKCQHAEGRFTCSIHMRHSRHTCKMQHTHTRNQGSDSHIPHICTYISPVLLTSFLRSA